jgi:hypothetical protein
VRHHVGAVRHADGRNVTFHRPDAHRHQLDVLLGSE